MDEETLSKFNGEMDNVRENLPILQIEQQLHILALIHIAPSGKTYPYRLLEINWKTDNFYNYC